MSFYHMLPNLTIDIVETFFHTGMINIVNVSKTSDIFTDKNIDNSQLQEFKTSMSALFINTIYYTV